MKICRIKIGMNGHIYRFIGDYHFEKNALIIEEPDGTVTCFNFENIEYFVINGCTNKESEVI